MVPALLLTDAPEPLLWDVLSEGVAAHDRAATEEREQRKIAVVVTDPRTGETLGGLQGRTSLGVLFIDMVHLPPALRGAGLGRRIMATVEREAVARGCRSATLITATYQAPGFYARLGWEEFGRVECDPPGHARVFMRKSLPRSAGEHHG